MPTKAVLSEERVEDTSDDASSTSEPNRTLKQRLDGSAKTTSTKFAESVTASEDESSSDDSDLSSTSSETSQSGSGPHWKRKSPGSPNRVAESPAKKSRTGYGNIKHVKPSRYAPPTGYSQTSFTPRDNASRISRLFEDMEGKQIWHIFAPKDMPMSELRTLDLTAGLQGKPIMEYGGTQYHINRMPSEINTLLVPDEKDGTYLPATFNVSRSFRVQESLRIKTVANTTQAASNVDEPIESLTFFAKQTGKGQSPRRQPSNLNGRYIPYGVEVNNSGRPISKTAESDPPTVDTDADREGRQVVAHETPNSSKRRKQKHRDSDMMEVDPRTPDGKSASPKTVLVKATPSKSTGKSKKIKEKSRASSD